MPLLFELDTLTIVGISIAAAFAVGQLFRQLGIPQVVGFIVTGVLLGPSLLHVIPIDLNQGLDFVSEIALGLIGFEMGGHLHWGDLRETGWSILLIVLLEALGAFLLVTGGLYLVSRSLHTALVFGALAAATDPASTVDVLSEYHARGPLTTRLLAVVGLDDAISLLLFSIAAALTEGLLGAPDGLSLVTVLELPFYEIGGAVLFGAALGIGLDLIMRYLKLTPGKFDAMVIPIGIILLCAGLARSFSFSVTLSTMVMGIVVINRNPDNGHYIRSTIESVGPVIYILFFALAGARLEIPLLLGMGLIGITYLILRGGGKFVGAWLGGTISKTPPAVRKNLGFALFAQAGVVIGLAIESNLRFSELGPQGETLGALVLGVITATTVLSQLIGPVMVKFAITRAAEAGKALDTLFAE